MSEGVVLQTPGAELPVLAGGAYQPDTLPRGDVPLTLVNPSYLKTRDRAARQEEQQDGVEADHDLLVTRDDTDNKLAISVFKL